MSPTEKKPKPRQSHDHLREKAISSARIMLAEGGPEFVKAREIAKELNVSVGSVYNLFGDLDQLLFVTNGSVYDELYAAVSSAARQASEDGEDLNGQLRALGRAYLEFVSSHSGLWAGVLAFNRRRKSEVPDWYRDKERSLISVLATVLAPLAPMIERDPKKSLAPQALWAAVHGIITVSIGRDGLVATKEEIANQMDLVVTAVINTLTTDAP